MIAGGFTKSSTIDYPGLISAVIFTPGCNYDCFYCHNRGLLNDIAAKIDLTDITGFLEKRAGLLDGVVISGGEPTLQPGLAAFLRELKSLGYSVKLDTNGSRPAVLRSLIESQLVDYVAVDYKAPWRRYEEICGEGAKAEKVRETFRLLMSSPIPWEARTTVIPQLTAQDLEEMARAMPILPRFVLKPYRRPAIFRPEDRFRIAKRPYSPGEIKEMARAISAFQPNIIALD